MTTVFPVFSGHDTFSFRYGWLKKGVDALLERPDIFTADDATSIFGVGKNMVRSIKYWCLATNLLEEVAVPGNRAKHLRVTPLGRALVAESGFDPYLEDSATLWLLHYQLTSMPGRSHTWYWIFNHFLKREFTRADLRQEMMGVASSISSSRASKNTIKRDVDCFVRTYCPSRLRKSSVLEDTLDCPLVELGLINELADHETLTFDGGERSTLPDLLFAYTVLRFWELEQPKKNTCSFERLAYASGSPGRVFRMTDKELVSRLERIEKLTQGALSYDETAGLKQVYRRSEAPSFDFLGSVYDSRKVGASK